MKVRIIYKLDKSVCVIHPAPNSQRKNETEKQWLERVFNKCMEGELQGLPYDDIDSVDLPQDREDREAWEGEKGKGITINQEKAKEIRDAKKINTLIRKEKERILEEQAIINLKKQGKL